MDGGAASAIVAAHEGVSFWTILGQRSFRNLSDDPVAQILGD